MYHFKFVYSVCSRKLSGGEAEVMRPACLCPCENFLLLVITFTLQKIKTVLVLVFVEGFREMLTWPKKTSSSLKHTMSKDSCADENMSPIPNFRQCRKLLMYIFIADYIYKSLSE